MHREILGTCGDDWVGSGGPKFSSHLERQWERAGRWRAKPTKMGDFLPLRGELSRAGRWKREAAIQILESGWVAHAWVGGEIWGKET